MSHRTILQQYGLPLPPSTARRSRRTGSLVGAEMRRRSTTAQRFRRTTQGKQPPLPPQRSQQRMPRMTNKPREFLSEISQSARELKTVTLVYDKITTGERVIREIEPYSIRYKNTKAGRRRYLYGWCLTHGEIHSFLVERISSLRTNSRSFQPRWIVEF